MIEFFNRLIYNFSTIAPAVGFAVFIAVIMLIGLSR